MTSLAIYKQSFTVIWSRPESSVPEIWLLCLAHLLVSRYIWGVKETCFHQLDFWKSIPHPVVDNWLREQNKPSGVLRHYTYASWQFGRSRNSLLLLYDLDLSCQYLRLGSFAMRSGPCLYNCWQLLVSRYFWGVKEPVPIRWTFSSPSPIKKNKKIAGSLLDMIISKNKVTCNCCSCIILIIVFGLLICCSLIWVAWIAIFGRKNPWF